MSHHLPLVGIDCRFAATHSGIGRYTRELVKHLLQRDDPWNYVFFTMNNALTGLEDALNEKRKTNNQKLIIYPLPLTPYSLSEQLFLPHALKKSRIDLFHSPHFNVPLGCGVPFIATIHDLILHKFPNEASLLKRTAYRFLMRHTVKHAQHLIAVSNATAEDLRVIYGEDIVSKISVIHEGISEDFQPISLERRVTARMKYDLPEQFFLYVGAAKQHKNVQMLIDACPENQTLILVSAGKEAQRLRLKSNVKILSAVPDEDLPALYSSARAYVSPSLAEGFNFPVLEALSCGCPVIATRRGSTPEVVGRFATLIDPTVDALRKAMENPPQGKPQEATTHARTFSWEAVASETAKIYAKEYAALDGTHFHTSPQDSPEARH